ncbi:MAG: hypothetical protein M3445_03815 [Actinomycetota bacterium]|nr:hypothetical protein [Actinomycetota bacterium]
MKRLCSLLVIAVMSVAALSACGGGDGSEFCDRFRDNAESNEFDDPAAGDTDAVVAELNTFRDIAPDELKDDYDTLIGAVKGDGGDATAAIRSIRDYAVENCDVKIDGS